MSYTLEIKYYQSGESIEGLYESYQEALLVASGATQLAGLMGYQRPPSVDGVVSHMGNYFDIYQEVSIVIKPDRDNTELDTSLDDSNVNSSLVTEIEDISQKIDELEKTKEKVINKLIDEKVAEGMYHLYSPPYDYRGDDYGAYHVYGSHMLVSQQVYDWALSLFNTEEEGKDYLHTIPDEGTSQHARYNELLLQVWGYANHIDTNGEHLIDLRSL